jgi:polyhydroxyalkanoate synthesis regulator phasin
MIDINSTQLAGNKPKGKRPYFLNDPAVERVLSITMSVAGELAVMRERMDTIEQLLAQKGILNAAEIDAFMPNAEQMEARQKWHAEYIARILRIMQQELEALQQAPEDNLPLEEIAEILGKT